MKVIIAVTLLIAASITHAAQVSSVIRPVETPATCSCSMPSSIQHSFDSESGSVFKAEAVEEREVGDAYYSYTVMQVKVVFRGCTPANEYIVVKSPKSTDACGVTFVPGKTYAVTAKLTRSSTPPPGLPASMEMYMATSCSYNKEWKECPYDDKVFLYYSPVEGCPTA